MEIDREEVVEKGKSVGLRHGEDPEDSKDLRDRVVEIAGEKDPEYRAANWDGRQDEKRFSLALCAMGSLYILYMYEAHCMGLGGPDVVRCRHS